MSTETDQVTPGKSTPLITNLNFMRIGGVLTIIAPFVFIGALLSGTDVANNTFDALGHLLYIVVILVLYHLFRDSGPTMRVAAVLGVVGLVFITLQDFLGLAAIELVAHTGATDEATAPAIEAVAETVLVTRGHLSTVGNALTWGIGGGLFSLAMIRTERLPTWLGWGGLVFAAAMLLTLLDVMLTPGGLRDSPIFFIGNMYGRLWLVVLGISLLRLGEDAVP